MTAQSANAALLAENERLRGAMESRAEMCDLNETRDGVGNTTQYQPQCFQNDGEFDSWDDIGFPTASRRNATARMSMFRAVNSDAKTRYLRIASVITVFDLDAALTASPASAPAGATEPLRIVAAAVIHKGVVHTGAHHHLCMWQISCCWGEKATGDQGFVASDGKFYGREESYVIAKAAGQIKKPLPYPHDDLFSEELWSYADWLNDRKMGDSPDALPAPSVAEMASGECNCSHKTGCPQADKPAGSPADGTVKSLVQFPSSLNAHTRKLVKGFAEALGEKLAKAEEKYGYSDGWMESEWVASGECAKKLHEHAAKGDPRDVAAYCAFLWYHSASSALPAAPNEDGKRFQFLLDHIAIDEISCQAPNGTFFTISRKERTFTESIDAARAEKKEGGS